uniref:NAD(P)H oxidase (H2O2-forming) n=1 Tax=Denticeps clupeoides TaxID=299321 RepID=A0AAY4B5T7_9TELE
MCVCLLIFLFFFVIWSNKHDAQLCLKSPKDPIGWEVQRYDGWYNSLARHRRGSSGSPLSRLLPARYSDGVYQPLQDLPNPRQVSLALAGGPSGLPSLRNQTVLSLFFGYHVVFEIVDSRRPGCPPEFMQIVVPKGDSVFDPDNISEVMLPFQRGSWDPDTGKSPNNPRTQLNHVTAWMDGSSIYGSSSSSSDTIRRFSMGLLSSGSSWDLPRQSGGGNLMWSAPDPCTSQTGPQGLYELGNGWGNENVFTTAVGIIWFRYHNYLATQLHEQHPAWSDEELFQNARKRVIATFQNIAFYEWLPSYLGRPVAPYKGYQKHVDPGLSPEFVAAASKFMLTMVPPGVYMRNRTCHYRQVVNLDGSTSPGMRVCNSFWKRNPNLQSGSDIDELIWGMASQIAEREDNIVVEDFKDYMYGTLRFSRSDEVALTIQRGRDYGLPSYNQIREALNLPAVKSWGEINPELNKTRPQLFQALSELYGDDISQLELFPGGFLESVYGPGRVFSALFLDQFERIRDGDRFWFENRKNGLFTEEEALTIRNTTLHDVILASTKAEPGDVQKKVFFWRNGDPCPQPQQIKASDLHPCTKATSLDFFDNGSKAGFGILIIVFFLFPVGKESAMPGTMSICSLCACEWQGPNDSPRPVMVEVGDKLKLNLSDLSGGTLRSLSLGAQSHLDVLLSCDRQHRTLLLKVPKEYDLVRLRSDWAVVVMATAFWQLSCSLYIYSIYQTMKEKELLKEAVTKEQRARIVETFFRHAFSKVLDIERCDAGDLSGMSMKKTREALQCELSGAEFAEALGLKPSSLFVESMFTLADKDGNGYLSFQEFLDVIVIFMKGTPEEKSRLLFSMHDIDDDGILSKDEFCTLLRSFIEISSSCLSKSQGDKAIEAMMQAAGFNDKDQITWEDFHLLLKDHEKELQFAQLNIKGREFHADKCPTIFPCSSGPVACMPFLSYSFYLLYYQNVCVLSDGKTVNPSRPGLGSPKLYVNPQRERYRRNAVQQKIQQFKRFMENYRRHIVCVIIVYGISAGVALERCYCKFAFPFLPTIPETSAVGLVVSRGSAAAISLQFPYMLLTVCRNLITMLRETFLNRYIPFDAAIDFHRLMAMSAILLTVVHTLGHVVNLYILSISDLNILACLFPKVFSNNGSELPLRWTFWFFETVPGITGILLLLVLSFMYVFASHKFRRISFRGFWITHYLYVVMYALTVIHGGYGLIQEPRFYIYLIPPALLFLLDKLISISRKKVEIPVLRVELLPSGVTYVEFKRPQGFVYRSGQWVRVACLALGTDEYHPFTLTSAPHEETLSLHIRAVGPWTSQLRECYNPENLGLSAYPKLYLDGPFGEGHQEWTDFEVSVLVGGGIGVTPFASILKDLVFKSSVKCKVQCKKVYFIWVTRTQRQFEWVSDIIRELEEADSQDLVSVHIYITQLAEKFDLRTTMLYVCERHFQKVWNRSLFTGLRSVTHFGRPPFVSFFSSLQEVHPEVGKIGVFSCGPPGLTKNVEKACQQMNKRDQTHFIHHYENF